MVHNQLGVVRTGGQRLLVLQWPHHRVAHPTLGY